MKRIFSICAVLVLGACNPLYNGGGQPLAQMTFDHIRPYPLYVASYETVPFNRGFNNPLPEGFVADPGDLVHRYFSRRFEAVGAQGKFQVVIQDASVEHKLVESENKVGSMLGVDKSDHYLVRVNVKLQTYGVGDEDQTLTLTVYRNIFVSEHSSIVAREKAQIRAMDSLIDDLDVYVRKILKDKYNLMDGS